MCGPPGSGWCQAPPPPPPGRPVGEPLPAYRAPGSTALHNHNPPSNLVHLQPFRDGSQDKKGSDDDPAAVALSSATRSPEIGSSKEVGAGDGRAGSSLTLRSAKLPLPAPLKQRSEHSLR